MLTFVHVFPGDIHQIAEFKWFHDIGIRAKLGGLVHVGFVRFCGHDDDGCVCESLILSKYLTDFEAQESWHYKVKENKLREFSARDFNGVFAVVDLHNGESTVWFHPREQKPLAGDANDEELTLSLFDGRQAVLYRGKLNERRELIGECWSTAAGHARYTATLTPDATL